ncbi:hypothetical protein MAC_05319 [Metarhizium acridum CQMa 102]|uniref:Uncharacterized protein n=1 Tax=Metarhizium acridum (strain CQMa 102) TaxID=655827 RepID=E9E621_METAQ|nr:uncharacterized protein MAC_05319 [Metarhizium acridum CQMa 102]EFY88701.1 hypothetical protein MAC_05319 [Metarhizium acridum CQMa 102]
MPSNVHAPKQQDASDSAVTAMFPYHEREYGACPGIWLSSLLRITSPKDIFVHFATSLVFDIKLLFPYPSLATAIFCLKPEQQFLGLQRNWPLDSAAASHNILGADLNSLVSGSEASMTPPSETRSLASSPPRLSMTPEQQEMRRHRERVRRESKLTSRMRRTDSASYTTSPSPMAMSDVSNAIPLPIYSTAPPVSLLAEPSQALHNQPYLSSYNQALQDASHTSQMFNSSPYQQSIPSTYSMPMDYPGIYSAQADFRTPASCTLCQRFNQFLMQITTRKAAMSELFRADRNLDAGSMGAMADSSPPLAIFFDISGRNQAKQPKLHAQIAALSLLEQPPEMDTCCTTSVSREEATTAATEIATLHAVPIHDWFYRTETHIPSSCGHNAILVRDVSDCAYGL